MNVLKEDPATCLRGTVDGLLCQAKALRRSCVGGCGVCEEWSEWVWSRVSGEWSEWVEWVGVCVE